MSKDEAERLVPADEEEEEEEKIETTPVKFEADTLDAAIVALSRLKHAEDMEWHDIFGYLYSILLHVGAQAVQFIIAGIMFEYAVEPFEDVYEPAQHNKMMGILDASIARNFSLIANKPRPADETGTQKFCRNQEGAPAVLHYLFLLIWFGITINALAATLFRFHVIATLPAPVDSEDMEEDEYEKRIARCSLADKDGNHDIDGMTCFYKFLVIVVILIPHLVCNLFVFWWGTKMLAVASAADKCAKACLKLGFIKELPAQMLGFFGPMDVPKYLGTGNYQKVKDDAKDRVWDTWASTVVKMLLAVVGAVITMELMFPKVNLFHLKCRSYFETYPAAAQEYDIWSFL